MNKKMSPNIEHINKRGVTGGVIDDLLRIINISSRYIGIYALPDLESLKFSKDKNEIILIVNIGSHWITIAVYKNFVLYLDSYGLPPRQTEMIKFLTRLLDQCKGIKTHEIHYNIKQIQAISSNYCGMYAALWAKRLDNIMKNPEQKNFSMRFYSGQIENRLRKNDKLCIKYLKSISE